MGPLGCHETSVPNYQCTLRNIPEERRSDLRRGGIPTSPTITSVKGPGSRSRTRDWLAGPRVLVSGCFCGPEGACQCHVTPPFSSTTCSKWTTADLRCNEQDANSNQSKYQTKHLPFLHDIMYSVQCRLTSSQAAFSAKRTDSSSTTCAMFLSINNIHVIHEANTLHSPAGNTWTTAQLVTTATDADGSVNRCCTFCRKLSGNT